MGSVPEFIAVTPDGKRLITSNWCGFDLSIVDIATGKELSRVPIGRHHHGLEITADFRTAYVAVMGAHQIAVVDLTTMKETDRFAGGVTPRHLALSGDGSILYVSNNRDYVVHAFNTSTRKEVGRVVTGKEPRTIALSPDGTVLYVVNYEDDLLTKVSTKDMKVLGRNSRRARTPSASPMTRPRARCGWPTTGLAVGLRRPLTLTDPFVHVISGATGVWVNKRVRSGEGSVGISRRRRARLR